MTETITRRFQFCAGHRVFGHESKCAHMHGHNYVALIEMTADKLDGLGRVVDFGVVKELVGQWIDQNWDHAFLVNELDVECIAALDCIPGQRVALFQGNPTAEVMARELLMAADRCLAVKGISVQKVTLWETENCNAIAKRTFP